MILGSHNSLTYLDGCTWWRNMCNRCQDKTLMEQLQLGVKMLDIKVRFNNGDVMVTNGKWESRLRYEPKRFVEWVLDSIRAWRPDRDENIYINLTLDTDDVRLGQEISFIQLGNMFKNNIGDGEKIVLIGGHRRFDEEKIIMTIPDMFIAYAVNTCSNQCRWYEKWFPKMFARRNNELNMELWREQECVVAFDFI